MKLFNKVAIIGVGLIGGSLGLAIKQKKIANLVIGVSRHKKTLVLAKRRGAVDIATLDLNVVRDADLIILATPVNTILRIAKKISGIVKPDAIVSDVGSTKKEIFLKLHKLFPRYIGSHPLAGSEKRSILNADPAIFKGSLCILTPVHSTHRQSLQKIRQLWNMLGTRIVYVKPSRHDNILSFVSHLPHLVAFSLVQTVPKKYLRFGASSFSDVTRIASSDALLWRDIFISNRRAILNAVKVFKNNLTKLETRVKEKDAKGLEDTLKKIKKIRDSLK